MPTKEESKNTVWNINTCITILVKFMEHTEYRIVNEHVTYRITARDWPSSYQYLIETCSVPKNSKTYNFLICYNRDIEIDINWYDSCIKTLCIWNQRTAVEKPIGYRLNPFFDILWIKIYMRLEDTYIPAIKRRQTPFPYKILQKMVARFCVSVPIYF